MSEMPIKWGRYHTLIGDRKIRVHEEADKRLSCSICYRIAHRRPPLDHIGIGDPYEKIELKGSNIFPILMVAHPDCVSDLIEGSV